MQRLPSAPSLPAPPPGTAASDVAEHALATSAGPSYSRNSTRPSGVVPKPLRKVHSELHFPVGFGPAVTREEAKSPLTTFAGKVDLWAKKAATGQGQMIDTAVRWLMIADRTNARTLDMRGLRLTSLPDCLHELTFLAELNLSHNRLRSIPELPKSLTSLDVRFNDDVELPAIPRTLHELKVDPSVAVRKLQEMEALSIMLRGSL